MKSKLAVVVPVAPFEPEEILVQSAECLKSLDYGDCEVKILYVVDKRRGKDVRAEKLRKLGVDVLERENTRGKRAGAINDAMDYLKSFNPEFVAIFDVDSRPERNFVVENLKMLEDEEVYISSSPRRISNAVNLVSKTVEVEYHLLNYLIKKNGYKQFNGLIGVLRAKYLYMYRLNEDVITEDADCSTRMHALGYKARYCESSCVYEQSPLSWRELYNQRKRWYYGGLQLWRYRKLVSKCKNRKFRYSWYAALTLTYLPVLMLPFLIISPVLILARFRNVKKLIAVPGLAVHSLVLQASAISALINFIRKRGVEWSAAKRVV